MADGAYRATNPRNTLNRMGAWRLDRLPRDQQDIRNNAEAGSAQLAPSVLYISDWSESVSPPIGALQMRRGPVRLRDTGSKYDLKRCIDTFILHVEEVSGTVCILIFGLVDGSTWKRGTDHMRENEFMYYCIRRESKQSEWTCPFSKGDRF